jgi:hypothetical protein
MRGRTVVGAVGRHSTLVRSDGVVARLPSPNQPSRGQGGHLAPLRRDLGWFLFLDDTPTRPDRRESTRRQRHPSRQKPRRPRNLGTVACRARASLPFLSRSKVAAGAISPLSDPQPWMRRKVRLSLIVRDG